MGTTSRGTGILALALQSLVCLKPAAADDGSFDWQALVTETRGVSPIETAVRVNRRINLLERVSDRVNWQRGDFWATPLELFRRGAGDCEDFAIAKYFLLRAHGASDGQLQLLVARLHNRKTQRIEPHMVLLYQAPGENEPRVLDNLGDDMLPLSARGDLLPVAAFDRRHYWRYSAGEPAHARPAAGHARWSALLERWERQQARALLAQRDLP